MAVAAVARCGPPTRAADGAKTANGESPSRLSLSLASASPSSSPPLPSPPTSPLLVEWWRGAGTAVADEASSEWRTMARGSVQHATPPICCLRASSSCADGSGGGPLRSPPPPCPATPFRFPFSTRVPLLRVALPAAAPLLRAALPAAAPPPELVVGAMPRRSSDESMMPRH